MKPWWEDPSVEFEPLPYDQFEQRARAVNKRPAGVRPVMPIESRNGPWSNNPNLGIDRTASAGTNNVTQEIGVLKLPEWGMPEVWSVMLGVEPNTNNNQDDVVALIDFGCGGTTQRVEVDWIQGTIISAPMNAVEVTARIGSTGASAAQDVALRASVARGVIAHDPPILTQQVSFNGTDSGILRIPRFASSLILLPTTTASRDLLYDSTTNGVLSFHGTNSTSFITGLVQAQDILSFANGIPIPASSRFFRWTQDSQQIDFAAIFNINL